MRRLQLITLVGLAGLISLAGPRSSAWAGPRAYIVQPGDTLWELAQDNGCSIEQLRKANELDADEPISEHERTRYERSTRAMGRPAATNGHTPATV